MLGNRSKKCPFYTDISGTISSIISLFRKLFFFVRLPATELTFVLLQQYLFILLWIEYCK